MAQKRTTKSSHTTTRSKTRLSSRKSTPKKRSPARLQKRQRKPSRRASAKRSTADIKLQTGLRLLRTEKSVAVAARKSGISEKRLRTYAVKKKLLKKRHGKWVVQKDVPRKLLVYSDGQEHVIKVGKFKSASLVGEYMAGVRWFVQSNDLHHLEPFEGKSVNDISGKRFPFETRPNVLHKLANTGASSFEDVYRLVL